MIASRIGTGTKLTMALTAALALAGCESVRTGVYGGQGEGTPGASYDGPPVSTARIQIDPDAECPQAQTPSGSSSWPRSGGGYQAVISELARECTLHPGNQVTIKVGVEGRMISRGGGGTFSAPVRIAVLDGNDNVVYSRIHRVSAPAGGVFRIVDDAPTVTLSQANTLASYQIQVGFGGEVAARRKPRRG